MKKLAALFLLVFLFSTSGTYAQESGSLEEMNKLLSKNLKYPAELRQEGIEGPVVVSVKVDPRGNLTGEYEFLSGNLAFEEEIERTLNMLKENWNPSFLEDKSYDLEYLMSFDFKLSKGAGFPPNPFMNTTQKSEKISPLMAATKALEENPYFPPLYKNRAEILKSEGKDILAEMDLNQAKFLKDKMLTEIVIVGYLPSGPKSL